MVSGGTFWVWSTRLLPPFTSSGSQREIEVNINPRYEALAERGLVGSGGALFVCLFFCPVRFGSRVFAICLLFH
jgi:hypothetical protein